MKNATVATFLVATIATTALSLTTTTMFVVRGTLARRSSFSSSSWSSSSSLRQVSSRCPPTTTFTQPFAQAAWTGRGDGGLVATPLFPLRRLLRGTTLRTTTVLYGRRGGGGGSGGKGKNKNRAVSKSDLPEKICVVCGRPFTWRKKWERCWDEVTCCSKKCNAERRRAGGSASADMGAEY